MQELRRLLAGRMSESAIVAVDSNGVDATLEEFRALVIAELGRRITGCPPDAIAAFLAGKSKRLADGPRGKGRITNRERARRKRRFLR